MVQKAQTEVGLIHPLPCWGNVQFWRQLVRHRTLVVPMETAQRQSFRNRYTIDGPNGAQTMTIPLAAFSAEATMFSVQPQANSPWPRNHFKALQTTYGSAPYWEPLSHELEALYLQPTPGLYAFNLRALLWITYTLELDVQVVLADQPEPWEPLESSHLKPWPQVFDDRHGFRANLCILDLVFNLGRAAGSYLLID